MTALLDALAVGLTGTCLVGAYFGRTYFTFQVERLLDSVIRFQARVRAGYYRKVDLFERCPACGHKGRKNLLYNNEVQRLMAGCTTCHAAWPKLTRIPPQAWDLVGLTMKANADQIANVREVFERANEPVIKKKEEKAA